MIASSTALPSAAVAQGTSVLTLVPTQGTLEMDEEASGALSSSDHLSVQDNYIEAWELEGRAGQSVTIDLESDALAFALTIKFTGTLDE